ncbi:9591_t:CDS:2 [Ambispora leptoticha]|uniref:9591_t:CDS:1 n=1 Tax=Ambispora leptoticha TaxID=144679 RepID=A0A9N9GAS7_9GLOM|nr:9591_t:CDS:2 [Ambispora leptoticha]
MSSPILSNLGNELTSANSQIDLPLTNTDNAIQYTDLDPSEFETADHLPGEFGHEISDYLPEEYAELSVIGPEIFPRYDDGMYRRRRYDDEYFRRRYYRRKYQKDWYRYRQRYYRRRLDPEEI